MVKNKSKLTRYIFFLLKIGYRFIIAGDDAEQHCSY